MVDEAYKVHLESGFPSFRLGQPASAADPGIFKSLPNNTPLWQDIDSVPTQARVVHDELF